MHTVETFFIFLFSLFTWTLYMSGIFSYLQITKTSFGILFAIYHYLVSILSAILSFGIYYRYLGTFSAFKTMSLAMVGVFIIEYTFWTFLYKGDLKLLNFLHFILPMFILATSIYLLGVIFEK